MKRHAECATIYHEIKNKSPKKYSKREEIAYYRYTQTTQHEKRWRVEHKQNEESCCCEDGCNEPAAFTYSKYHYCNLHRPICIVPKCNQVISTESKNKCRCCYRSSMVCREIGCDKKVVVNSKMFSVHSNICTADKCDKAVTGKAISGLLFCHYHRGQERIRETWGTLTCTKRDYT